jgi:hypothetical protein
MAIFWLSLPQAKTVGRELTSDDQPHSRRQAGARVEIREEMISAGVSAHKDSEPKYIHDALWPAADFAIRELVRSVYRAMRSNSPGGS